MSIANEQLSAVDATRSINMMGGALLELHQQEAEDPEHFFIALSTGISNVFHFSQESGEWISLIDFALNFNNPDSTHASTQLLYQPCNNSDFILAIAEVEI